MVCQVRLANYLKCKELLSTAGIRPTAYDGDLIRNIIKDEFQDLEDKYNPNTREWNKDGRK